MLCATLGLSACATPDRVDAQGLRVIDDGLRYELRGTPSGLSGLTYLDGDSYLAVADRGGRGVLLRVPAGPRGVVVDPPGAVQRFEGGVDLEAVAYDRATGTLLIADESGPTLWRYASTTGGSALEKLRLPDVYRHALDNRSLEAMTLGPDGSIWIANEEALAIDGPPGPGSLVRLQRLAPDGESAEQFAYRTDGGDAGWLVTAASGLVELASLPDGRLLALERAAGIVQRESGFAYRFRSRLFLLDTTQATDTTGLASLHGSSPQRGDGLTPVAKTKLWQAYFDDVNLEGLAVGRFIFDPRPDHGGYWLVLVSDDGDMPRKDARLGPMRFTVHATEMRACLIPLRLELHATD